MNDFYESILNIRNYNPEDVLKGINTIVFEEVEDARNYTDSMQGLCKVLSNNIKIRLDELKLNNMLVNLRNYGSVIDHEFIISSFKDKNKKVNYILIDATYSQFVKNDDNPYKLTEYPAILLQNSNLDLLNSLLNKGFSLIDEESFKNYINSFGLELKLEDVILSKGDNFETNIKNNKKR